jgi:hypothetical protein
MMSVIMLNVANDPFMLSVFMLNVVMLRVVAPFLDACEKLPPIVRCSFYEVHN